MITLSMPPTATDFAVRLSPLKISYFFLPAASDGLIFVSEITVPDGSDYFTETFPFLPPLLLPSEPFPFSENRMRLTADRSKTAPATPSKAVPEAGLWQIPGYLRMHFLIFW